MMICRIIIIVNSDCYVCSFQLSINLTDDIVTAEVKMYQPQPQQQPGSAVIYAAQGQPVAITTVSPVCESYRSRQSTAAGILLIIAGVLSIVFNVAGMFFIELLSYVGHGIWCGIMVSKHC